MSYVYRLQDQYTTAVCMRSAAEQWLALRQLVVMSLFMCIATVIVIFTSDISKYHLYWGSFQLSVVKPKTK